jgi:tetratricopeptide (TPR) repeat protein
MVKKTIGLLCAILLVAISIYMLSHNGEKVSFHLTGSSVTTTSLGTLVITTFIVGFVSASAIAGFFRLRAIINERQMIKRESARQAFVSLLQTARGYVAGGEWAAALETWKKLLRKDPTHLIAYVEMSRCYERLGLHKDALKVLDEVRPVDRNNVELLFRAAELNLHQGNKTAAVDNLKLILDAEPMLRAATMAFKVCEELARYDDAVNYLRAAIDCGLPEREAHHHRERIHFKKLMADHKKSEESSAELSKKLYKFIKAHDECSEALAELGRLEIAASNIDKGSEYLSRAGRLSGNQSYWNEAITAWLRHDMAGSAVSAARAATRKVQGRERLLAEIDLIKTLLVVTSLDDARSHIDGFKGVAESHNLAIDEQLSQQLSALNGLCHHLRGEYRDALASWHGINGLEAFLAKPTASLKDNAFSSIAPHVSVS